MFFLSNFLANFDISGTAHLDRADSRKLFYEVAYRELGNSRMSQATHRNEQSEMSKFPFFLESLLTYFSKKCIPFKEKCIFDLFYCIFSQLLTAGSLPIFPQFYPLFFYFSLKILQKSHHFASLVSSPFLSHKVFQLLIYLLTFSLKPRPLFQVQPKCYYFPIFFRFFLSRFSV